MDPLNNIEIKPNFYFPSGVYTFKEEKFIPTLLEVSKEYLDQPSEPEHEKEKILKEAYPITQTKNFNIDPRIEDFRTFLGHASWKILDSQGYNMSYFNMMITELWCQEHKQNSGHDKHIHGSHGQLCGFYFLECEKDSMRALIHDPRDVKVYSNLPEKEDSEITYASSIINYTIEPGMFLFMNTWLPHSFTRNISEKTVRFIHFNIGVSPRQYEAEVI